MGIVNSEYPGLLRFIFFTLLITIYMSASLYAVDYYVDSGFGSDKNTGLSAEFAWQSLDKVNAVVFKPGDRILFRANGVWSGQLWPKGSGSAGRPVVIDKYGEGGLPVFNGEGRVYGGDDMSVTVKLFNQQYWELRNLEITNFQADNPVKKCAVFIGAKDMGAVFHLFFINLVLHNVNGDMSTKDNGGIFMNITRDAEEGKRVPTYFENVLIRGCYIHDVDRTGISNKSAWQKRTLHENIDWTPSRNIVIRDNTFERTGANALIVRVADAPLVERNLFTHCAIKGSGNASFPFNCDNALFQHNEACFTKYNEGDADAGGFDSDYRCKNTVIQYNYSHDNEYGGVLVCCMGRNDTFNNGTVIRYNIFENNKHHVFRVSGTTTNTRIYNNVIFTGQELNGTDIIWHKSWRGYSDQTAYYNNIFYTRAEDCQYNLEKSTNNVFEHNVFFGIHPESEPQDPFRIVKDSLFVYPGRGAMGMNTLNGYQLQDSSPCINAGKRLDNHGEHDFWSRPINDGQPDIGAFEK